MASGVASVNVVEIDWAPGSGAAARHRLSLHAAVLQLSLVIRLQQHGPDQLDDRRLAREDADHIGPPLDLLVEALDRIGGVQPVRCRTGKAM